MSHHEHPSRTPEEREGSTDPGLTDPSPEQQDPESSAGAEAGAGSSEDEDIEFLDDPSRNPDDPNIERYKGG